MLTKEQRLALPKKKSTRAEIDTFYLMAAALSALMSAEEALEKRARLIPRGWCTLRMLRKRTEDLVLCLLHTFEPEKQRVIAKQMMHLRLRTCFGPQASKDPEMFMLPIEDLGVLIRAATGECKLRMCSPAECAHCQLGKVIDGASFVSRGDRAWWEVFEQSTRRDIGADDGD